jgi:hypothetical protein
MCHILAALFLVLAVVLAVGAAAEYRPGTGTLGAPPSGGVPDYSTYRPPQNMPRQRSFPTPAPHPGRSSSQPYSTAPEGIYPPEGSAAYGSGFDRLDAGQKRRDRE